MEQESLKKQIRKLSFITSPLLAIQTIAPIFITTQNDWYLFFPIWVVSSMIIIVVWHFNLWCYEQFTTVWIRYIISFAVVLLLVLFLRINLEDFVSKAFPAFIKIWLPNTHPMQIPPKIVSVLLATSINGMIWIFIELLLLRLTQLKITKENAALKIRNVEAQFQTLKNQLQPHFLFNALSTLKTLIKRNSPQAEDYVLRLSDFLRVSLTNKDKVSFEEDIEVALNYLELQMIRFKGCVILHNELPKDVYKTYSLPLLTIQTLFENAIKHNSFSIENPLHLYLLPVDAYTIVIKNNKQPKTQQEGVSSNIGLSNLSQRFVLLGGEKIEIHQNSTEFSIVLKLFR